MAPSARSAGRWEPAELGVHPVAGGGRHGSMPAYVRRPHDENLRVVLDPAVADSRLVVVRGDSCTGKSRAAYEAVADVLADWVLEYPPTAAALAARLAAGIPAGTVLWLGELRRYAETDDGAAALSRLGDLLDSEGHLIITTIWPGHWEAYVAAAGARRGGGDPDRVAGRLLAGLDELAFFADPNPAYGGVVDVPARFTAEELATAAGSGDPVLTAAVAAAGPDGRLTQCLAGVPGLLRRYDGPTADRHGQAIITAAMDATRFGHAGPLPAALLHDAAAGYLAGPSPADGGTGPDAALAWASAEIDGTVRALEPVPPGYRIAGYLDQHGRRTRQDQLGPASLWDALAARAAGAGTGDLTRLAQAARDRGLYRHAAALWAAAAGQGSADAARRLVAHLREVSPGDAARAAGWAAARVRLGDPWDVARLVEELHAAGADDAIRALVARDAARQASLRHPWDAIELLGALHAAGAGGAVDILAARIVAHADLEDLPSVASLLRALHAAQAGDAIRALVARDPARHANRERPEDVAVLLEALHAAGAGDAARALATWAANDVELERPQAVARLLRALRVAGEGDALRTLLVRDPVGDASFEDPWEAAALLAELRAAGDSKTIRALLARDPASLGRVDFPDSVAWLLAELRAVGADETIRTLLARDPASQAEFYDLPAVGRLLAELRATGDSEAIRTLATRAAGCIGPDYLDSFVWLLEEFRGAGADEAARILLALDPARRCPLDDPGNVAWLLEELHAAGASDAARALLDRDPAGQVSLDPPGDVARLLRALRAAGAGDAARALAARAAGDASLEDPGYVAELLTELTAAGAGDAARALLARDPAGRASLRDPRGTGRLLTALRAAGAGDAARALAARAADAGMFDLVPERASYPFGREPDGAASPPWDWARVLPDPAAAGSGPAS